MKHSIRQQGSIWKTTSLLDFAPQATLCSSWTHVVKIQDMETREQQEHDTETWSNKWQPVRSIQQLKEEVLGKRQGVRPEETEGLLNNSSGCLIPGCTAELPVTCCVTHQVNRHNFVHIPKELQVIRHKTVLLSSGLMLWDKIMLKTNASWSLLGNFFAK